MIKVLLAYEDFNELTLTESYLKRVGFDIVGISNEVLIQDQILSFNPEVIVAFGKNQKVSSFSVGQKLKDNHRYHGRVVIIVPKDVRPTASDMLKMKMDAIMEAPFAPEKLIQVLCRLCGHSADPFLEKLSKARLNDPNFAKKLQSLPHAPVLNSSYVTGGGSTPQSSSVSQSKLTGSGVAGEMISGNPNSETFFPPVVEKSDERFKDPQRQAKYAEFIKQSPSEVVISKSSHTRHEIREKQKELEKGWDYQQLDTIDDKKRKFAEALFKKNGK